MGAQIIRLGLRINYTAPSDIDYGDVVVQGDLVGIATRDIKSGEVGRIALAGLFGIVKDTGVGTAINAGTKVYWDANSKVATASDGGGLNKFLGVSTRDAQDGDRFVRVLMGGGVLAAAGAEG
ncbi:MAG: DUF2190 family protein [Phycisphaeraceae bacterium]|nr:DUF2190 family protein [Phycisphaeraceae bacterium]